MASDALPNVAPFGDVHPFPADRIVRALPRNDAVAVTHLGQTTVYRDPHALGAAVLERYAPQIEAARREAVDAAVVTALAAHRAAEAAARRERRSRDFARIALGSFLAVIAGAAAAGVYIQALRGVIQ